MDTTLPILKDVKKAGSLDQLLWVIDVAVGSILVLVKGGEGGGGARGKNVLVNHESGRANKH
jgi:hypothetical protein